MSDGTRDDELPGGEAAKPSAATPETARAKPSGGSRLRSFRSGLASVVWLIAVLAALVLAVGALCVALDMNRDNAIIAAVLDLANALDFDEFKKFEGADAETESALVNWGLAAVIWLTVGKILDKLIRP